MIQDMLILHEPPTSYRFHVHLKPVNWGSFMPDIVDLFNICLISSNPLISSTSFQFFVQTEPINWESLMPDVVVLFNKYSTSLESFNINLGEEINWL